MLEHELAIRSMHCERCAASIRRYLRDQPGVESAEVSFESARGRIVVESSVDVDRLVEAIDAMGFDASLADGS